MSRGSSVPVAIVGMGGVFPGAADVAALWPLVHEGRDATAPVPPGRWVLPPDAAFDPAGPRPDHVYARTAGLLDEAWTRPDPTGLALDPALLETLDPSVHVLLRAGREAWNAVQTGPVNRQRVGVVLGNIALPTDGASALSQWVVGTELRERVFAEAGLPCPPQDQQPPAAWNRWVIGLPAALLARGLGLGGDHHTLDAACASSLFALHLAVASLQRGESDLMLTGGTSRPSSLYTQMGFSQLRALSPTGRCTPFDRDADGLVVGEGAGVLALKRLDDAIAHGDRVWAVVRGCGLSNDLDGNLLAPSTEGQLRAMQTAYREAGWEPGDVDYIECHATGTTVGDAVEFESLRALRRSSDRALAPAALGATKANVGHLLTGAGAVALIKATLAMDHGVVPPVANYAQPGAKIDLAGSGLRIPTAAEPWPDRGRPRRAAVSGFGFGGTNAHILLEQFDPTTISPTTKATARSGSRPAELGSSSPKIAVVGMAAHIGPWTTLQSVAGRLFGEDDGAQPQPKQGDRHDGAPGWFIDHLQIPLGVFRIPPSELASLLPQQLLALEVARQALADVRGASIAGPRTGVFVGVELDFGTTDFHLRWCVRANARDWAQSLGRATEGSAFEAWVDGLCDSLGPPLDANRTMGGLASIAASRIAREFRLGGPSYTVCSEDTSGTSATLTAMRALARGELDAAVVGAVDLGGDVRARLAQSAMRAESGQGTPFDPQSSGATPSEGAVVLVLKRLDDALAQGDRVYGVLAGGASGTESEVAAACGGAYQRSAAAALRDAKTTATGLGLVEAAAVGDPRADATEARALARAVGVSTPRSAIASSFGDLGAARGLLGIASACLRLHHRRHAETFVPTDAEGGGVARREPHAWLHDESAGPRRVLVADRSVGGHVTHLVVEDYGSHSAPWHGQVTEGIFAAEGDSTEEICEQLRRLDQVAEDAAALGIDELARGWLRERPLRPAAKRGLAVIARDPSQLRALVEQVSGDLAAGRSPTAQAPHRVFYSDAPLAPAGEVAFVFPGSGSHFVGMGRRTALDAPDVVAAQEGASNLIGQLRPQLAWHASAAAMDQDAVGLILSQVSQGVLGSDAFRQFGVHPSAVIGYSLGETAGLFAMGAWRDRDTMLDRVRVSTLFTEELAGPCRAAARAWGLGPGVDVDWRLGVVEATPAEVDRALANEPRCYRLIVNTPTACVIGGEASSVRDVALRLAVPFHPLEGVTSVHCEVARQVEDAYRELHELPTSQPEGVRFYSGAWGRSYAVDTKTAAAAITDQATLGVDFPKVVRQAYDDGVRIFIEIGPGGSCTRMIDQILGDRPFAARTLSSPGSEGRPAWLRALGMLLAHRVPVDFGPLFPERSHPGQPASTQVLPIPVGRGQLGELPPPPAVPEPAPVPVSPVSPTPPTAQHITSPSGFSDLRGRALVGPASAAASAHEAFLKASTAFTEVASAQLLAQADLVAGGARPVPEAGTVAGPPRALDRDQCMTFAVGRIGDVLGPRFADIDAHPTRVRLPAEPLMLVDRITEIDAEPLSMKPGRVVTEHDVREGAWYLDGGRIPTCVAVEAGQADLFLSAYLGIDFETRGHAVYRLLDATVTFHDRLPSAGSTIRYDIRIDEFFRQGDTWLFRFGFDATVSGRPLMTMRNGVAGFFSDAALAAGRGVVDSRLALETERPHSTTAERPTFAPQPAEVQTLSAAQLGRLREGDLGVFGPAFAELALQRPLTIPGGAMELVHRITAIEPTGGRYGLGMIRGEADIHPNDWFITCHFSDDPVMPGTLMYECCMHTLRVFLLSLGWVGEEGEVVFEPKLDVRSRLKCRGQVLGHTEVVTYEVTMREFGADPEPYVICDATMYADGKRIVDIGDMSAVLRGTTAQELEQLWQASQASQATRDRGAYDKASLDAYAYGKPSDAFGPEYARFDAGPRKIARLPGAPFQFIDRVPEVSGRPFVLESGCSCRAEVDPQTWAWTLEANRQPEMAFAVLLEIGLQACGWLAGFAGSALASEDNLHFRNLGGDAVLHQAIDPDSGPLSMRSTMTSVSASGGMVIQHFDFSVETADGRPVYEGTTYFGFFSGPALAEQVGVRDAEVYAPTADERARGRSLEVPAGAPMPGPKFRMVDRIDLLVPDGGPHQLGYVQGSIAVNPEAWFFTAHFFEDPVWPGSLGLEAFLQLLKVFAIDRWALGPEAEFSTFPIGKRHRWSYRGQVIPSCDRVEVRACIRAVDDAARTVVAEGFLCVDGRPIYQMHDFSLEVKA